MPGQPDFEKLVQEAAAALAGAVSSTELEQLRVKYLGRKGDLAAALREISNIPTANRPAFGATGNQAKQELERLFAEQDAKLLTDHAVQPVDVTLPGRAYQLGHRHPVTLVRDELEKIFLSLGFSIADGPEIEDDWHNFEALNMKPDHPARDMQDTFYVAGSQGKDGMFRLLPRTHTSGVQIRSMQSQQPPLRLISPGRVYRNEAEDATHSAVFSQLEGLVINETATFADLKGTLITMARQLLGPETRLRFRPSFFPYTEPSAEIDMSTPSLRGGKWLELGGSGMVHPKVLRGVGYDPKRYRGFAFGIGPDRIAMLKYGITDIRSLYRPDVRVLEQF